MEQWKLWVWGREKKITEEMWAKPKGPAGYYQTEKYMHRGSPRRRIQKGAVGIFE